MRRTRRRKRGRRMFSRINFFWIFGVLVVAVVGNLLWCLRSGVLEARVRAELARLPLRTEFDSLSLDWPIAVQVAGLRMENPGKSGTSLLALPTLQVVPDVLQLCVGQFAPREIVLNRPTVELRRDSTGRWNIETLIDYLSHRRDTKTSAKRESADRLPIPSLRIVDGKFKIEAGTETRLPQVEAVNLRVWPRLDQSEVLVEGELDIAGLEQVHGTGQFLVTQAGLDGALSLRAERLDLMELCERFAPRKLVDELKAAKASAALDLNFELDVSSQPEPLQRGAGAWKVAGQLVRGRFRLPRCDVPVKGLHGEIELTQHELRLSDVRGTFAGGNIQLSGALRFAPGLSGVEHVRIEVRADSIPVDDRIIRGLPASAQEIIAQFQPRGRVGVEFELDSDKWPPPESDWTATIAVHELDMAYYLFAQPLTGLTGQVAIRNGRVLFTEPLRGQRGDFEAVVRGDGVDLRRGGLIDVAVDFRNLRCDESVRAIVPPQVQSIWDELQLFGWASGTVTVERPSVEPDESKKPPPPRVVVQSQLRDCRLVYRPFPYAVEGISGEMVLDLAAGRVSLIDLRGSHGTCAITGGGHVLFGKKNGKNGSMQININSDALPIEKDIVACLPLKHRKLIDDFRLRGELGVAVEIATRSGKGVGKPEDEGRKVGVSVNVGVRNAHVQHRDLRYPLTFRSGSAKLEEDGTVTFKRITTVQDGGPQLSIDGAMKLKDARHELSFNVDINSLVFDQQFTDSLPPPLDGFVRGLGLRGTFRGKVGGSYVFDENDPTTLHVDYHGRGVETRDARLDFGLRIREVKATINFDGLKEYGRDHYLSSTVLVESARFNRLHLTNGEVKLAFGKEHMAIALARQNTKWPERDYRPPPEFVERLANRGATEVQLLAYSPDLYGGTVNGFMYVDLDGDGDMGGDFVAEGLQVPKAAADVFGVKNKGLSGTAKGAVRFSGRRGDVMSIVGKGTGNIKKARLMEVPLFLGILSLLFGDLSKDSGYFRDIDIDYTIKEGKFRAARPTGIQVSSSGLSLAGGGTMDFNGRLKLVFLPRLFGLRIPLLDDLIDLIKAGLAQIQVTGTLTKPKVKLATGAGQLKIDLDSGKK